MISTEEVLQGQFQFLSSWKINHSLFNRKTLVRCDTLTEQRYGSLTQEDQRAMKDPAFLGERNRALAEPGVGEGTPQIPIYIIILHHRFSKVWSRLLFLGRFSSQSDVKTFSFLMRPGLAVLG